MKKSLFTILLIVMRFAAQGQSITFADLVNLTFLNHSQAQDYLMIAKTFKPLDIHKEPGKRIEKYKDIPSTRNGTEVITIEADTTVSGESNLRIVSYSTNHGHDLENLLTQAKKTGLKLIFNGSDTNNKIYHFENYLYKARFYLGFDKRSGIIEIEQKLFENH